MKIEKPTQEEIKVFIEVIDILVKFEAEQRHIRGYGAFIEQDLPIPEFVKVRQWLVDKTQTK